MVCRMYACMQCGRMSKSDQAPKVRVIQIDDQEGEDGEGGRRSERIDELVGGLADC
jgi:hypothetical protein